MPCLRLCLDKEFGCWRRLVLAGLAALVVTSLSHGWCALLLLGPAEELASGAADGGFIPAALCRLLQHRRWGEESHPAMSPLPTAGRCGGNAGSQQGRLWV